MKKAVGGIEALAVVEGEDVNARRRFRPRVSHFQNLEQSSCLPFGFFDIEIVEVKHGD
jgi:hypothetical protein